MIKEEVGKEIIKKLIGTQSVFQGRMLQKTVFVKSEKKILNKQMFYNIDALNVAINQGCKASARIMEYGIEQELVERSDSPVVFSPYVTFWADGNYYILVKRENVEEMEHFRLDLMKNIAILERGVDMIFGSFNPSQYAKHYILQHGENRERFDIECDVALWQELAELFGQDAVITKKSNSDIRVRINTISSQMRTWVLKHVNECEVVAPKKFRDEIQKTIMEAYKKYWM